MPWQAKVLALVAGSPLSREASFGGATALSVLHLHHRLSEDLDFFLTREVEAAELRGIIGQLRRAKLTVEGRTVGPRHTLVLADASGEIGHVDFACFPYDPIDRPARWNDLRVDSFIDMAVNKLQAVLTRARDRDFVDLYFLLKEGPERDVERLLSLARAKFDVGASRITLAEQLLRVEQVGDLPRMLRPLELPELRAFHVELARRLVRAGPA